MVRGGSGEVRKDARGSKDRQRVSAAREAGEGFPEEGISESLLKSEQELGKQRPCVWVRWGAVGKSVQGKFVVGRGKGR